MEMAIWNSMWLIMMGYIDWIHQVKNNGKQMIFGNGMCRFISRKEVHESQIITRGDDGKIRFRNNHGKVIKDIGPPERIYDYRNCSMASKV